MEANSSDYLAAASLAVSGLLVLYKAYRRYIKSSCRGELAVSVAPPKDEKKPVEEV